MYQHLCWCEFRHRLALADYSRPGVGDHRLAVADHSIPQLRHSRVCRRCRQEGTARSMDKLRRLQQRPHQDTDHPHPNTVHRAIPRHTRATSTVVHRLPAKATDKHINKLLPTNRPDSRTRRQVGHIRRRRCRRFTTGILAVRLVQTTLVSHTPVHSAPMTSSIPLPVTSPQRHTSLHSR